MFASPLGAAVRPLRLSAVHENDFIMAVKLDLLAPSD